MPLSVVQHVTAHSSASSNDVAATLSSSAAGSVIVVAMANFTAAATSRTVNQVTDNRGNTYTQASGAMATDNGGGTADDTRTDIWYCLNPLSGVTTVTVTFNGTAGTYTKDCFVWEVSGFSSAAFDVANGISNTQGSASTDTGAAVTTTSTTGFVVGVVATADLITVNPKAGNEFSSGGDINGSSGWAGCSLISTTAASHTPEWTDNGTASSFCASTAALKESAGGGPTAAQLAGIWSEQLAPGIIGRVDA